MSNLYIVKTHPEVVLPTRNTNGAAGMDLYAFIQNSIILEPQETVSIPTGLIMEIPKECYGQIATRSSVAKKGVIAVGGVIDCDYRGEIIILLSNLSKQKFIINNGDRIAQLIVYYIAFPEIQIVHQLSKSVRNDQGFGSSGK